MVVETVTRILETCGKNGVETIETKTETDEVVHVRETGTGVGLAPDRAIGGLDLGRDLGKGEEGIEIGRRDGIGTGIETGTGTEIGTGNQVDGIGTEIAGIERLIVMTRPLAMFRRTIR